MRKKIAVLLAVSLVLASTRTAYSIDYSEDESYWYSVCNGRISPDLLSSCQGFNAYLTNKANSMESQLEELDVQIQAIQGDIDELVKVANDIQTQIDAKDREIQVLENQINELENNIAVVEDEIVKREQDIEVRDELIKEQIVQAQTFDSTYGYIDFLMGAKDFVDLLRRISIMNQLTSYEQNQIEQLNNDIEQLEHDRKQIEIQKESIEAQKSVLDQSKAELEGYKQRQDTLIAQYKQKEEELMDAYMRSDASINEIRNNMPSFSASGGQPVDTSGFGPVVSGYLSAGTWYYPGGGRHSGMDIAGPVGTPITAPFNGIVAIAQNLTSQGGLGTRPYTGNNVMLIGTVNGTTYAIHMLHMQYNSITVSPGQTVNQGEVIGARGSTGNSTGPHVHIDLYNLGSMSVEEAYNRVRNTGTYTFGMDYHAYGWECSNKAPICRERPEEFIPY